MINREFIRQLEINQPLKCYYKTLKHALQIYLGYEKQRDVSKHNWAELQHKRLEKVTKCVREVNFIYEDKQMTLESVCESLNNMRHGLSTEKKAICAHYIASSLTI